MTSITLQNGKVVLDNGKVGTEQACCCDAPCQTCECGWLIEDATYDYELTFTCDGGAVTQTGQIVDGEFIPDNQVGLMFASLGGDGGPSCVQFAAQFFCDNPNITCSYLSDPYDPEGYDGCCDNRVSLAGEYTLDQIGGDCAGAGATATLTIL